MALNLTTTDEKLKGYNLLLLKNNYRCFPLVNHLIQ